MKIDTQIQFQEDVVKVLNELQDMLFEKNRKYGDAALNPERIFATASAVELINVRIDDKLNRIKNKQLDENEDAEWDLLGYLILKRVAKMREENEKKEKVRSRMAPDPIYTGDPNA